MSGCGSGCGCGSDCKCGSGCGCKMYPDLGVKESISTNEPLIVGVAPSTKFYEMSENSSEGGHGCKCGSSCSCDPCNC